MFSLNKTIFVTVLVPSVCVPCPGRLPGTRAFSLCPVPKLRMDMLRAASQLPACHKTRNWTITNLPLFKSKPQPTVVL